MLLMMALACTKTVEEVPAVSFLTPAAGATVPAGDVAVSVIVEHFTLEEVTTFSLPLLPLMPAVAFADNEGEAAGFVRFSLDDASLDAVYDTQYTYAAVPAGEHTASAELFYADGDPLDPRVSATVTFTAQ